MKTVPRIALLLYPEITPFHYSVPYTVFSPIFTEQPLFELKVAAEAHIADTANHGFQVASDGGLELITSADIVIVPGWHDLNARPSTELLHALQQAHQRGALVVGLCYGAYALAYAGLLDNRRAATHWLAEQDFRERFPHVRLDTNALYIEDSGLITSAGTAAGLDCCLYIVRKFCGVQAANRIARVMVVPPHREGGQAQYIEQPVAHSTKDITINKLLDYLRQHLEQPHRIDELAERLSMSRRTFTRHFQKATGKSLINWLNDERIQRSCELLEAGSHSIERIAELCGFNNTVSFRQHFQRRHQVSPSVWRRTFTGH